MPSDKILKQKQEVVKGLAEKMKSSTAGVLVDFTGVSVAEDTRMRAEMRKENIDYSVAKNTLLRLAAKDAGFETLDSVLHGTTALALSESDPVAPAKIIAEYAKKFGGRISVKAGFIDGKVISAAEVASLAALPSKKQLHANFACGLGTILSGPARAMNAHLSALAYALKATLEKNSAEA